MQRSKKTQLKQLINNLFLGCGVILLSVTLTATITKTSISVAKSIAQGDAMTSNQIITDNIYDVITFDSFEWKSTNEIQSISYDAKTVEVMDITEEIDPKKVTPKNKVTNDVFNKKIIVNLDGKKELVKLDRGFLKMDENYYRYSWHPWIMLFQMLAMIIVLFATSFKYTKSMFNAIFNGMVAPFFAFSDLVESSKVKKILTGVVNTGITIMLFAMTLKLYRLFSAYAATVQMNAVQQVFIQLFLAFIVLEGPFIIQELTGQDGGVRSEAKALAGSAVGAVFLGGKVGQSLKNGFDFAKDTMKKGGSFVSGLGQGVMDSMKESKDPMEDELLNETTKDTQPTTEDLRPDKGMDPNEEEDFADEVNDELMSTMDPTKEDTNEWDDPSMNKDAFEDETHPLSLNRTSGTMHKESEASDEPLNEKDATTPSLAHPFTPEKEGEKEQEATKNARNPMDSMGSRAPVTSVSTNDDANRLKEAGQSIAGRSLPRSQSEQALDGSLPNHSTLHVRATVPASISQSAGAQQFQEDLRQSGKPITTETVQDVLHRKVADHQIKQAEERKIFQRYNQIGRNTTKKMMDDFVPRKEKNE